MKNLNLKSITLNFSSLIKLFLFAGFVIPMEQSKDWQAFEFSKIPHNQISYSNNKINISVKKSASPLIYSFNNVKKITSASARFTIKGSPIAIAPGAKQGEKNNDDFSFRLGLVKKGEHQLNWIQRQVAAGWILKMHDLAPKGIGIDKIHFLTATQQKEILGTQRVHPLSDYFIEEYISYAEPGKEIILEKVFDSPIEVVALWISSDGDDTQSNYSVEIKELKFNYK